MKLRRRFSRGIALVMALYMTVILLSLGTFFIADQINKSKTVLDYDDAQLSLQAANAGLSIFLNYLGNPTAHWLDAVLISAAGTRICPGDGWRGFNYQNFYLNIQALQNNPPNSYFLSQAPRSPAGLFENDYQFTIFKDAANDPFSITANRNASVTGTLKIFYSSPAQAENCGAPAIANPAAVKMIFLDVQSQITGGGATYASREIQWSGKRNPQVGLQTLNNAVWNCVGCKPYDNITAYVGNGFTSNGPVVNLGLAAGTNVNTNGNALSSPYASNLDGTIPVPQNEAPVFNGPVIVQNQQDCQACPVKTGAATQLPTGYPFGAANANGSAPSVLLQDYQQAASDSSCGANLKTVFAASSEDVGSVAWPNADQTPHAVEYDSSQTHQKPGYAITDITLNNNGTVTINQIGYYSGGIISSTTLNPANANTWPSNGVIYSLGGNVRIHGNLQNAGLTVVSDQGEAFFNQGNANPVNLSGVLGFNPNCVATYGGQTAATLVTTAARYNSSTGGPPQAIQGQPLPAGAGGVDYWIPNSCPNNSCSRNTFTFQTNDTQQCANCLVDGTYYTNYTGDPASAGNAASGYHADDVNGQPITLSNVSPGTGTTTDAANFYSTIFAPPPAYNTNGSFANNTILTPTTVTCTTCPGSPSKVIWPYPGVSALTQVQSGQQDDHLVYLRQAEYSEGNLTIAGDTTATGASAGFGLLARNFVFLDDFTAGSTKANVNNEDLSNSKSPQQDYYLNVRADILSTNAGIQWEGNTAQEPAGSSIAQDAYMDGDYAAMNGKYGNGTTYQYSYSYQGQNKTVTANSWQGAPFVPPGQNSFVTPLVPQNGNSNWNYNFVGSYSTPYMDVVNSESSPGTYVAYRNEIVQADPSNVPPAFPVLSYNVLPIYIFSTISYADLGALQTVK